MNDNDNPNDQSHVVRPRDVGHTFRLIIIAALIAALVVVALDNREDVRIGYAVGDVMAPVWTVLVAAAICGIVIGWMFRHRSRRRD